jgi:hypothetical protein
MSPTIVAGPSKATVAKVVTTAIRRTRRRSHAMVLDPIPRMLVAIGRRRRHRPWGGAAVGRLRTAQSVAATRTGMDSNIPAALPAHRRYGAIRILTRRTATFPTVTVLTATPRRLEPNRDPMGHPTRDVARMGRNRTATPIMMLQRHRHDMFRTLQTIARRRRGRICLRQRAWATVPRRTDKPTVTDPSRPFRIISPAPIDPAAMHHQLTITVRTRRNRIRKDRIRKGRICERRMDKRRI